MTPSSLLLLLLGLVCCLPLTLTAVVGEGTVTGRITSLNGEPVAAVVVRAQLASDATAAGAGEEVTTDAQGVYTFKFAKTGSYRVSVKTGVTSGTDAAAPSTSRIVRATPEFTTVNVASATTAFKAVDFIAFRRASKFDLTGEVVGISATASSADRMKYYESLEIQLALSSNPSVVVAKTGLLSKTLPYFSFLNIASEQYILTVKSSLPTRTYAITTNSLTISLTNSVHVQPVVDISYKMSSVVEMQSNSLWNSLLVVLGLIAFYYKEKSVTLALAAVKSIQTRNPSHIRSAIVTLTKPSVTGAASFAPVASSAAEAEDKSASRKPKFQKKEKTHVSTFVRYDSIPLNTIDASTFSSPDSPRPAVVEREVAKPAPAPVVKSEPKKRAHTPAPAPQPLPTPSPPPPVAVVASPPPTAKAPKSQKAAAAAASIVAPKPVVAKEPVVIAPSAPSTTMTAAAPVAKFCSGCGAKRADLAAKFCSECGQKF